MEIASGQRVLVGMTGGLDSTVAAFLLKCQGLEVIGISFQFLGEDAFDTSSDSFDNTCHLENLEEVKTTCEHLGVPFYAVDAQEEFNSHILRPLTAARLSGHFFSSCVACNRLRFKLLCQKAKKTPM